MVKKFKVVFERTSILKKVVVADDKKSALKQANKELDDKSDKEINELCDTGYFEHCFTSIVNDDV